MSQKVRGTLLIVEDNEVFRALLRGLLRERLPDVEVFEAADLAEGTVRWSDCRPKVVFLDIALPDGNGLELADGMGKNLPGAKVFVLTGNDLPEYRDAAFNRGASQFFSKHRLDWDEVGRAAEEAFC